MHKVHISPGKCQEMPGVHYLDVKYLLQQQDDNGSYFFFLLPSNSFGLDQPIHEG